MEEEILSALKRKRGGLSFHRLAGLLHIRGKDLTKLRRRLKTLQERGLVLKRKDAFFIPRESKATRGEFLSSGRGFGFVKPGDRSLTDIFIPARYSLEALDGDTVEVIFDERGKKEKPEGRVVRILKKGRRSILGLYRERFGQPFFLPLGSPSQEEIPVVSKGGLFPAEGMIVEMGRESRKVEKLLGMPDDPGVDTQVIVRRFGLESQFTPGSLDETGEISSRIPAKDRKGRKDYRRWRTMTIDGESAQDFDDAVSIRKLLSGNYLLGVHIADVSNYVLPGSALDRDAFRRGTSVYFPDLTLPMLPEKLSNDLCSLRPRKTRLTVSVLLEFDRQGRMVREELHPSLIRTEERLTYSSVYQIFRGEEGERKKFGALVPDLLLMRELASLLRRRREEEGSLNFDLLEPELVYQEGKLKGVAAFEPNEAHHLIEEFMVAANEAVASFLGRKKLPCLYRIHSSPAPADIEELKTILAPFGFPLPSSRKVKAKELQQVLKKAEGRPEEKFIGFQVLKALKIAVYSEENIGHFGLAKEEYAHFTSPIRRYPDLLVHRVLKSALEGKKVKIMDLPGQAAHCSERERRADEAERELLEWRIYRFLKDRLGEEVKGFIAAFTRAGLVVELDDYFVDGIIPYTELGGDYYYKRDAHQLIGKSSGKEFRLGQRVRVILASVDPLNRRMSLVLSH